MQNKIAVYRKISIVLLVVLMMTSLLVGCGGGSDEDTQVVNRLFFVQDGSLMMYEPSYETPKAVAKLDSTIDSVYIKSDYSELYYVVFSEEGYRDIYYVNLAEAGDELKEPIKIANDVDAYTAVYEDDKYLLYEKDTKLYVAEGSESKRITSNESTYYYSNGQVMYITADDGCDAYVVSLDNLDEQKLIASLVDYVVYNSDDFSELIYATLVLDENQDFEYTLYDYRNGESNLISEHVGYFSANKDGFVVYGKLEGDSFENSNMLYSIVSDELLESDSKAVAPSYDDYYITIEENGYKYETFDNDAYDEAYAEYNDVLFRNNLRERYKETPIPVTDYSLYSLKDGKSKKILEDVDSYYAYGDWFYITQHPWGGNKKLVDISELADEQDIYNYVYSDYMDFPFYTIFDNEHLTRIIDIKASENQSFSGMECINGDLYFGIYKYNEIEDSSDITLYMAEYNGSEEAKLTEIMKCDQWLTLEDKLFCFTDLDYNNLGDMYDIVNGKPIKVDEDVCADATFIGKVKEGVYAYAKEGFKGEGTMYLYENGKSTRVGDNVDSYIDIDGKIYYIKDKDGILGDLYCFDGTESTLVTSGIEKQDYFYLYFI